MRTIVINNPGPQGPVGPIGLSGSQGPSGSQGASGSQGPSGSIGPSGPTGSSAPFNNIGGNIWATTSSLEVTGSFLVSGSSTFTNIGPAIFSGSANITGATTMSSAVVTGNVTVLGTASINVLQINTTINSTGSNTLGDAANDTQTLYGSVVIPTGSLTVSGNVSFGTSSAGFYWDNTNGYLGIKKTNPAVEIDVVGSIRATSTVFNSTTQTQIIQVNSGVSALRFFSGSVETARYDGNNWGFYTTTPTARLQVKGSGATSATTALHVENTNASASLVVLDNGFVGINTGSALFNLDVNGTARVQNHIYLASGFSYISLGNNVNLRSNIVGGAGYVVDAQSFNTLSGTNNEQGFGLFSGTYAPTSASGTPSFNALKLTPTINQTGGANGITRGLYINPTLTAAADWRAIESTNGRIVISDTATVTGSNATSLLDLSQTWNTSGTPIGIKLNITDTTSATLSDLISLQVGGSPRFRVLKSGFFVHNTGGEIGGNLVVGGSTIDASSQLEIRSTTRGFLIPRMTTTQRDAILTPTTGLQIFNSTEGYTEYYDSFWGWMPIANQNEWKRKWGSEYFNDFGVNNAFTGDGVFQTFPVNGGSYNTSVSITGTYIGYMGLSTGVNTNGQNAIRTDLNFGRFWQLSHRVSLVSRLFIPTLSDVTDRYNVLFGISGGTNSTVNSGCAFIYDEGGVGTGTTASPNWQIITATSSVRTNFVTSVPVAINTWYSFRIESNSTFTEIYYYINDVLVRTETTNIPTGVASSLPIASMTKTAGTTARILAVDYLGYKMKLNSAR